MLNFENLETDVFEEVGSQPVSKVLPVVELTVSDAMIAQYREEFNGLIATTREGYESVRKAIAVCRTTRTGIEKKRKELNEDARAWISSVNSEAKRLTSAIEEIEEPLKLKKQAVDDEKERLKREAEEARINKINDRMVAFLQEAGETCALKDAETWSDEEFTAALAASREAYSARLEAQRKEEEERQRLEAERAAEVLRQQEEIERQRAELESMRLEQERLRLEHEAEMAKLRAEQEERDRIERDRMERERLELQAERERLEREEAERLAKAQEEQEAIAREKKAREDEERARQEAIELQARLDALRPDMEQAHKYRSDVLAAIEAIAVPDLGNPGILVAVRALKNTLVQVCEEFSGMVVS